MVKRSKDEGKAPLPARAAARAWSGLAAWAAAAGAALGEAGTALAAPAGGGTVSGSDMLGQILEKLQGGINFLGVFMIVVGLVGMGYVLFADGPKPSSLMGLAIGGLVGGLIIMAASVFFTSIDTSWIG